jgi:pyruvate/2-oxoglutarate/acetoin dehydrogenase E1 component
MQRDPTIVSFGEDVGRWGGGFKVTKGLTDEFGVERNFDSPISETAVAGGAVGMAITGLRPVVDLQFADCCLVAMDEIYNRAAKWRYMHGGNFKVPVVFRAPMGVIGGAGAEHSQCPESIFMHCPGIKIAIPATPYDAKGLMITSIRDDNPVLFLEHKMLYDSKGDVPEEAYNIPFGKAIVRREGTDVTVITWSMMVNTVMDAADKAAKDGINVEVIDPRTLVPLDKEAILQSVRKTGRLVIVHEAPKTAGAGAELAAMVAEEAIYDLKALVRRVCAKDVPIPQSSFLEPFCIPQVNDVLAGIHDVLAS